MFRGKVKGRFGKVLDSRIQKWAGARPAAARIRVDDSEEMRWWYYQEFGTASYGPRHQAYSLKPDPTGKFPGKWAAIWRLGPENTNKDGEPGKDALSFEHNGEHVVTIFIPHHDGIPPKHIVTNSIGKIRSQAIARLRRIAPQLPDHPDLLRQFVLDVAADAKEIIKEAIAEKLHERDTGRLKGGSPAEVYDQHSTIVPQD